MNKLATDAFRTIGPKDAIPNNFVVPYYLGDRKQRIAVARVDDRLYAFDDLCTCADEACSLSGGLLTGMTIMCQCHGSRFDITTGAVINGPATNALNLHEVQEIDGSIRIRARLASTLWIGRSASRRFVVPGETTKMTLYQFASSLDRLGMAVLRTGLIIVLLWIGGLKFAKYEADGIVPLVANSPLMSFFYHYPAPQYRLYVNKEGELVPQHRQWHESNNTYPFAIGLGVVIISIGLMIATHPFFPRIATIGSFLLILMAFTTLSFLVTTPEAWVPSLGDAQHGFPFLSIAGRLIIKDAIMLGGAIVTMADSARSYLRRNTSQASRCHLKCD